MTSKFSWIPFIPFTIAAVFLKLAQVILPDGAVFGMSDNVLNYAASGCVAVIFLAALILCAVDRRISLYYVPHRNIPAGIVSLLLAFICAADGANRLYLTFSAGGAEVLEIIESVLLLLASVVFIVYGLTHSFVNRDNKSFALFNLMPALLCAIRLVRCFISFTTISIRSADITLLFCYVFATLFFFNLAVTISLTETKNAVKSCFIFGFPAAAMLLAHGVHAAVSSFNTDDIFANAGMVEILLMAVYIICFMLELTIFIKDRDHVKITTGKEEVPEEDVRDEDNYILASSKNEKRYEPGEGYLGTSDISDYLVDVADQPAPDGQASVDQSDSTGYITEATRPQKGDTPVIQLEDETVSEERAETDYTDRRMDEIDKLILELSGEHKD